MQVDTHQKALRINLDPTIYGTLAEIGAGQEVARWFLRVGGASGTVAKSMSAYDMAFSDAIYGKTGRYVSRERLAGMLDHEYALLRGRLSETRSATTLFFVFADTVSARNYAGTNECHGWMGLRFQTGPGAPPSEILLHVNLMDRTNELQQEALGVLGVNLIHAAFYERASVPTLLARLYDEISATRIEIDVIAFDGPEFTDIDPHAAVIELIQAGCAEVVFFGTDGRVVPPSEVLRKRRLLLAPGIFSEPDRVHAEMLSAARTALARELPGGAREPLQLFVLTPRRPFEPEPASTSDLLARVERLRATGFGVLVAREPEVYRLVGYAARYTAEPVRFVLGVFAVAQVFQERLYGDASGQLLEALGKLFAHNVRVYVWPMPAAVFRAVAAGSPVEGWASVSPDRERITAADLHPPAPVAHLYAYLTESGFLVPLDEPAP